MNYNIVRHEDVRWDLSSIYAWLALDYGERTAEAKIDRAEDGIHSLATLPHFGSRRFTPRGNEYRIKVAGKAVIAFTVDDDRQEVFIVAVNYGGMDWQARVVSRLD